ncbi:19084_t:CDS:2, partial [Dentiscutata erythropus]
MNESANNLIKLFETGNAVYLKGKFVDNNNYYLVSAISIKPLDFDFNTMPAIDINTVIVGIITQTVKKVENDLIFEFYIEKRIEDKEVETSAEENCIFATLLTEQQQLNLIK